ncbi:undecaprenyl-phosphate glucose phosphotransferase [Bradyrhizobium sp. STM 3843]|uniref:undecaprenyl-phosphate glucose phosphotransferase n=1 Tax=Bradyrhizobium sp. STM 3843 TaxID=551947 RepID=UPI00031D0647|nr:undecaprenyl-phosphate glucose phosphotransferase [Bradyrhizobium sp. STM 3843]
MSIKSDVNEQTAHYAYSVSPNSKALSSGLVSYGLLSCDATVIFVSALIGGVGYQFLAGNSGSEYVLESGVGLLASILYVLRMHGSGHYDFQEIAKPRVELKEILVCWFSTGLLLAFIAFLLKISVVYSRGAFIIFGSLAAVGLLLSRKAAKEAIARAVERGAIGGRDTVLIGDFAEMAALTPADLLVLCGATEVNRFILGVERDISERSLLDTQVISAASQFVRKHNCRQVLIALPWNDIDRIELVKNQMKLLPVASQLLPDLRIRSLTSLTSSAQRGALVVEIQRAPLSEWQRLVKRGMDVVFSSLAIVFFLPIMFLAAAAIKLGSPGPVIFRQLRRGFNGKEFVIYKFRTMTVQENGSHVVQATRNDMRVTGVGRLLRAASIDELPQLFNVVKGDMSLVGPRPHALAHDSYFETVLSDYAVRHHVKPGITGWAQCNGARGETPTVQHIAKRVKLDLWYINNWSIWLDLFILIKTVFEVLRKRNAY